MWVCADLPVRLWRKLQTSDHFYYMCTKYWSDGDVHKYFSVYDAPHDSYVILNNVLTDLEIRLKEYPSAQTVTETMHDLKPALVKSVLSKKISARQLHTPRKQSPQTKVI